MMTQLSENCRKTAEIYGDLIKQLDDRIQKSNEPLKSSGEKTKLGTGWDAIHDRLFALRVEGDDCGLE